MLAAFDALRRSLGGSSTPPTPEEDNPREASIVVANPDDYTVITTIRFHEPWLAGSQATRMSEREVEFINKGQALDIDQLYSSQCELIARAGIIDSADILSLKPIGIVINSMEQYREATKLHFASLEKIEGFNGDIQAYHTIKVFISPDTPENTKRDIERAALSPEFALERMAVGALELYLIKPQSQRDKSSI